MSLQATALGLHTHGMGGVDKEKARKLFAIPEDFEVGAAWALGYLGEPEALPEQMQEMEKAARTRKPLEEFVFSGVGEAGGAVSPAVLRGRRGVERAAVAAGGRLHLSVGGAQG